MTRAIIYVRLSSYSGEADTTTSPERQEESCRQYAASKDWEVVGVVRDLDVSGSDKGLRLNRPGLKEVRAQWHEADVLLFSKIDRLARNVLDWSKFREEADAAGVALVSVADNLDLTSPNGQFIATILQAFAQMEAAIISTRTSEAVAYMAREGRHRGGNAPFGWRIQRRADGPGYRLALDKERAPIVREAVDRVLAGENVHAIQEDFNARGLAASVGAHRRPRLDEGGTPTPVDGWVGDSLRRLLRRPILRGMQVHRGEIVRADDGHSIRPHDALVTDEEWTALRFALDHRVPSSKVEDAPHLLLRDLVSCAFCGQRIYSVTQPNKPPQWVCSGRVRLVTGAKCPTVAISRPRLEEYVVEEALRRFGDHEAVEVRYATVTSAEVNDAEESLSAVLARLRVVDDPDEEERLFTQRRALRERIKGLQRAPETLAPVIERLDTTFAYSWDDATDADRVELLSRVLEAVIVRKGVKGRRGLDPSRLDLVFKPAMVEGSPTPVSAGVYFVSPDVVGPGPDDPRSPAQVGPLVSFDTKDTTALPPASPASPPSPTSLRPRRAPSRP